MLTLFTLSGDWLARECRDKLGMQRRTKEMEKNSERHGGKEREGLEGGTDTGMGRDA